MSKIIGITNISKFIGVPRFKFFNKLFGGTLDPTTKLLLKMNGTNGSTTFTDETGKAITVNGNTKISTEQYKFNGSSGYFDGNNDLLTTPDNIDFKFGSDTFTIDTWIRTSAGNGLIIGQMASNGFGPTYSFMFIINSEGKLQFIPNYAYYPSFNSIISNNAITDNQWHHVAIIRSDVFKVYIDGVVDAPPLYMGPDFIIPNSTELIRIGGMGGTENYVPFNGYMNYLRVTKGKALWTTNFTPPTTDADYYV
jgi:hypothetical protein